MQESVQVHGITMPQHHQGVSLPVCMIPADINLQTIEDDCDPEPASSNQLSSHLAKLFSCNDSDTDDMPNSQGSVSSQVFELFHVSSQTTNDSDDESDEYPDLSNLVTKVSKHTTEHYRAYTDRIPRSRTPTNDIMHEESSKMELEVTPVKSTIAPELDPLTPTANLKMLISAASPEIRHRESQRELQRTEEVEHTSSPLESPECVIEAKECAEIVCAVSRKEKSLGLLCQRFIARYPGHPGPLDREIICLDEVAKELMVERRRIYDIVNVLESVEMVSRVAKNRYTWHGRSTLQATLLNLKMLAEGEGFAEKIDQVRMYEEIRDTGETTVPASPCKVKKSSLTLSDVSNVQRSTLLKDYYCLRKDKSLGIMSQKFLMLFLVSQNKPINLDLAAKIIIGDPSVDLTENAKFKTKIRRLYDIANILTSLDLIRKIHLTEAKGRKPAFKYIGPEVGVAKTVTADASQRPTSRHSLLDCIKKPQVSSVPTQTSVSSPANQTTADSTHTSLVSQKLALRKPFSRHLSLDQICEVAEQERNRLYFESKSQPSSPLKQKPKSKRALLPKTKSMPPVLDNTIKVDAEKASASLDSDSVQASLKHFVMIRSVQGSLQKEEVLPDKKNVTVTIQKLPIQMSAEHNLGTGQTSEKLLLKTCRLLQQSKGGGGERQPRLVKVSRDQLDSVLKSLQKGSLPVSVGSPGGSLMTTQPQPTSLSHSGHKIHMLRMQPVPPQMGLSTPRGSDMVQHAPSRKRSAKDALPNAGSECYFNSKRPRFGETASGAEQQPRLQEDDGEVALSKLADEKCRPSPRALHLDPEFQPVLEQSEKALAPELPASKAATAVARVAKDDHLLLSSPHPEQRVDMLPAVLTPREQTPEASEDGSPTVTQPLFQFANSDYSPALVPSTTTTPTDTPVPTEYSPVLPQLVPLRAAGSDQVAAVQQQHHHHHHHQTPSPFGPIDAAKYIHLIRSSSPTAGKQFQMGVAELAALHLNCPRHTANSATLPMVSPVPIHVSPMAVTGQPGFMLKQFQGIRPSSNAIINLIPHLAGDAAVTTVDLSTGLPQAPVMPSPQTAPGTAQAHAQTSEPLLVCPNHPGVVTPAHSLISARDHHHHHHHHHHHAPGLAAAATTNLLLTPRDRGVISGDLLTPNYVSTPPGGAATHMPVTPPTYFRSTPGGVYQLTTMPHVVLGQSFSAFQPLNSFAGHSITTTTSTARRLTLVEGDRIV